MKNKLFVLTLLLGIHSLYSMDPEKSEKKVSFASLGMRQTDDDRDSDDESIALSRSCQSDGYDDEDDDYGLYCDFDDSDEILRKLERLIVKQPGSSPTSTAALQISPVVAHRSPSVCTIGASAQADIFDFSTDANVLVPSSQDLEGSQPVTAASAELVFGDSDESFIKTSKKRSFSSEELATTLLQRSLGAGDRISLAYASTQSETAIANQSEQRRPFSSGGGAGIGLVSKKDDKSSKKRSFQSAENVNPQREHIVHHRSVSVTSRSSAAFASAQSETTTVSQSYQERQFTTGAAAGLLSNNPELLALRESRKRSFEPDKYQEKSVQQVKQSSKQKIEDNASSANKSNHDDDTDDDL